MRYTQVSAARNSSKSHQKTHFKLTTLLLSVILSLGLTVVVMAQGGARGAISGLIKDPSGAAVPNSRVEVINKQTGTTEREVTTKSDGSFSVTLLPIGLYRLIVTADGFSKAEVEDVKVSVTETTTVPITLRVGAVSEAVTITSGAATVQLSSATTGQTIQNVGDLPLATRNFLNLLALSTGANSELTDTAALGRGAVSINVNGQRPVNNNYQLDGINSNDINLPQFDNVPLPNPQTVAEFKTQTSLYDASQGRNGGGNIQVALKSGSNAYHGDAFEFFRNNVLNANDFFLNRAGTDNNGDGKADRPLLRQNQFGFSFGGPAPSNIGGPFKSIFKNLFFFTNYQGTRAASGVSTGTQLSTNIPVLPSDRTAASLINTYFPAGLPAGFTSLDPSALAVLNLPASKCSGFSDGKFCIPSLPGTPGFGPTGTINIANLNRSAVGTYTDDQFTITADKQLTEKDKISLRYFYSDNSTSRPFGTASTLAFQLDQPGVNRFVKLGWTRVFSQRAVNDFRFGLNRFGFDQIPTEPIMLADIGAIRGNSSDFPAAYRVNVTGAGFSIGTAVNDDRGGRFNTFVFGDDFSYNLGRHQFRAGGELSRYQLNRYNNFATRGSVTFAGTPAGAGGAGIPALTGFQNFLLGRVTSTQGNAGFSTFYFRAMDAAGYFQDDWKFSSRLTLNLGVRWEGLSTAHEKFNFLSNFQGLGDGQPGPIKIIHPADTPTVGTPGVSRCTLVHCFDGNNFGPRIGFAWDVLGDQKTALRGGYGVYFQRVSNQPLLQTAGGLPFAQAVSATSFSVTPQNPFPSILPTSAFPLPTDQQIPTLMAFDPSTGAPIFSTVPGTSPGSAFSGFFFFPRRDFRAPYAQQWNLTIQREFARGWALEAGYVGTRGVGLIGTGRPLNPSQICTSASPCVIPSSIGSGVTVPAGTPGVIKNSDGSISITQSTTDNADARVPVQFLGLANGRGAFQEQSGSSTYHSLQTSVTHRFARGLYFQGAYTFSRSIDNSSGSAFADELNGLVHSGDLLNVNSNRGLSDFDRTHRLVFSYVMDLPFAKLFGVENRGLGKLAHGWAIQGSTVFQSGTPFLVIDSSSGTLQDLDNNNGFNRATLAPGTSINDLMTSGNVRNRLDNYVNLNNFLVGTSNNCVNNQNVQVPCSSADALAEAVGSFGRNALRGPFQQNWDMSFVKATKITEKTSLEFRGEFFNIWNHAAFQSPQAAGGSFGNYGIIDIAAGDSSILATANRPRIVQFALKLNF
jgi:carboxypeptidase family protein/TonB-dependent receptor-like protein